MKQIKQLLLEGQSPTLTNRTNWFWLSESKDDYFLKTLASFKQSTPINKINKQKSPSKYFLSSETSWKTSWRRLQRNNFSCLNMISRHLQHVLKKSWKTKKCYAEDVFNTSSPRLIFAGVKPWRHFRVKFSVKFYLHLQTLVQETKDT